MKGFTVALVVSLLGLSSAVVVKRDQFAEGQPIDPKTGKSAPITGGTNQAIDRQNPSGLGRESTDAGNVPNLKWPFSLSKTRIFPGGWTRTQDINDLPQSKDIAGAQQHLTKGGVRELHWHSVSEWGVTLKGRVLISAVDADGRYEVSELGVGDIWYFPKGVGHTIQGLDDENEYLLAFDAGDFNALGVTFMVDDWINHTPRDIVAKNFGLKESDFKDVPKTTPYILNTTVSNQQVDAPNQELSGDASFVYRTFQQESEPVPGNGGTFYKIVSTNFPTAKTIAATYVVLAPGGLREMHWHPNLSFPIAEEWLYFHQGQARASVFIGDGKARMFDFQAGDTAVFPDKSGHYIENTSDSEDLIWIEIYKSDKVQDIPLGQWLALTPADNVAATLEIDIEVAKGIKDEKQVLLAAQAEKRKK